MRDITSKQITLRSARAISVIFCSADTISLIKNEQLPKGNLFDVARAAGFIGAKLTPQLLPHCHPVGIDGMDIQFSFLSEETHAEFFEKSAFEKNGIVILGEAKSIGRTGIEMEMLTAVSVAALEIYDMLKPVDTMLEIGHIKLLKKTGGKSDRKKYFSSSPTCAILVCSDSTAEGKREDKSGKLIRQMLEDISASVVDYKIVADQKDQIQEQIKKWVADDVHFVFTTGGTGLGPRDNTVEAVSEMLERDADGITEAIRNYGQMRTPLAMMSRAVAGSIAQTLVVTLPGSSAGAKESMEAILPAIFHARKMMKGGGH
ncbi:cyclic pyranopterin monophosphate synthase subunit MoaC [Arcticibacter pallidicorallinus]|uniref:Cyclic pyranopterin monophosphate synthase subunit MoaC n=1 Tax=Arcticibacter pallidicorallinus TaxID=1259464 RepID=A0A2T0U4E4_9SPHI|nr:bifunctional molybdenum cofactor biosynthesis protein MoaC/MoaB [Arcticibacter pallidicorallinus]PRY52805.1 cyclic pyranopterin monophosphate synthase subunit MoaC [Arcticibacter pallidicorallinus]